MLDGARDRLGAQPFQAEQTENYRDAWMVYLDANADGEMYKRYYRAGYSNGYFYTGYRFKCGTTNRDLYEIFLTGVDGTPMPSFADVIKPEEAWDLVHYLRTLQIWHKSPELTLWESTKEGAEFVKAEKVENTYTGNPIHP
jgi:hypothetical protein